MNARLLALALIVPPFLAACSASVITVPPPALPQPISVVYSEEGASGWNDVTVGTYRVPNTSVFISGHQSGGVGFLFGAVGVLAQDASQASAGGNTVKGSQDALHVDLVPQARAITQKLLASGRFGQTFAANPAPDGPVLTVTPYVVITTLNDTEARPYVILKASLKGAPPPGWSTRYIASEGKKLPISGDNSWTANDARLLHQALTEDLDNAIAAMLEDLAARPLRDDAKLLYVEAGYPFIRPRWGVQGYKMSENDKFITFVPKLGPAMVMSGVHVLDKSTISSRPAGKDDKFQVLEEGK